MWINEEKFFHVNLPSERVFYELKICKKKKKK